MWNCNECGHRNEEHLDTCTRCATQDKVRAAFNVSTRMENRLTFRIFRGTFASWEELFSEAAEFATGLGRNNVLNISHSVDRSDGVVTVWYWVR